MSANAPDRRSLPSERMRRRRIVNRLVEGAATVAALAAVAVLSSSSAGRRARLGRDQRRLLHEDAALRRLRARPASGIENAIIGTLIIIGIARRDGAPVGVLTAIYLNEFAPPRLRRLLTLAFDVLNGIPAIVLGIFVFVFARRRPRPGGVEGELRARDPDGADDRALDPGGARARARLDARGEPRARRRQVADDPQRRPAAGGRRNRHGRDAATARAAGETAPLLFTSRSTTTRSSYDPRQPLPRSRCSSSPPPNRPTRFSTSRPGAPRSC